MTTGAMPEGLDGLALFVAVVLGGGVVLFVLNIAASFHSSVRRGYSNWSLLWTVPTAIYIVGIFYLILAFGVQLYPLAFLNAAALGHYVYRVSRAKRRP